MSARGFEPRKLLSLFYHPGNSRKLVPQHDWHYGAIGAGVGVAGFMLWAWAEQTGIRRSLSLFGGLVFGSIVSRSTLVNLLWLSILSFTALVALLTLAGNRLGTRKLGWKEAAVYCGGAQAWYGMVLGLNALLAIVSWKVSLTFTLGLLLLNMSWLLSQSIELHGVCGERKFAYMGMVLIVYIAILLMMLSWMV